MTHVAPPWDGFYGGLHAGYGKAIMTVQNCDATNLAEADACTGTGYMGWFGGAQFGINIQRDTNWVGGLEVNLSHANINGTHADGSHDLGPDQIDFFGSVVGKVGMALDAARPVLVFATGGLAWAHINLFETGSSDDAFGGGSHLGWTIGLGAEMKIQESASVFAQLSFMNLLDEYDPVIWENPYGFNIVTVKVGFNYYLP